MTTPVIIKKAGDAIHSLGVDQFILYGEPRNEQEFNIMFKKVVGNDSNNSAILSSDPNDFGVTWSQVAEKIAELTAAEPLRQLRQQRNQKLAQSDWMAVSDRTMTPEQIAYRQALRDMPVNNPDVSLNEAGELININWPTEPQ